MSFIVGRLPKILAVALISFVSWTNSAHAYPEFIAYGYKTCLTCHYLGTGGGGLTDYGRAVFASEIAAKPPGFGSVEDEKLAEYSHFLGGIESPTWFKPGIKYRRLAVQSNPGAAAKDTRYITMQADLNLASFTNEDATFGAVATLSYVENQRMAAPNRPIGASEMMAREYFVRWLMSENSIWYVGFFDKSFGIKHPDHTAVNRDAIRLGMNDQVHGILYQWQKDAHEIFIHPYIGNAHLTAPEQRRGGSVLYEYQADEKVVFGASARSESNAASQLSTVAGHTRIGLLGNHTFMNEFGIKSEKVPGGTATTGLYDYLELQLRVVRGMYFNSQFQLERSDMKDEIPFGYRWGFGFLYFPMQRIELRTQAIQYRTYSTKTADEDQWVLQGQLHLSL